MLVTSKNFTAKSRQVASQMTGHHYLFKLTHKVKHHMSDIFLGGTIAPTISKCLTIFSIKGDFIISRYSIKRIQIIMSNTQPLHN